MQKEQVKAKIIKAMAPKAPVMSRARAKLNKVAEKSFFKSKSS